jgi:hypothetical protein
MTTRETGLELLSVDSLKSTDDSDSGTMSDISTIENRMQKKINFTNFTPIILGIAVHNN